MVFYDPEDRAYKEIFAGIRSRTFWGENLLLAVVDLDANAELPTHSHPHEQSTYVLEGELEFNVGGECCTVKPGNLIVIPGNVEHTLKVGARPARVLDIFSPVREDLKY
ncbi:MAG: cupin domain-containing protein [Anaerolineales bacterium]|nr:cupin domain-containing protein [Anaerolineales bacterium]